MPQSVYWKFAIGIVLAAAPFSGPFIVFAACSWFASVRGGCSCVSCLPFNAILAPAVLVTQLAAGFRVHLQSPRFNANSDSALLAVLAVCIVYYSALTFPVACPVALGDNPISSSIEETLAMPLTEGTRPAYRHHRAATKQWDISQVVLLGARTRDTNQ
ncbi:hypothetical protein JCM3766R1_001626 [Sporobolomyces carnicolor]